MPINLNGLKVIMRLAVDKASQVFSKMIKTGAKIEAENLRMADIAEITAKFNEDSSEVVSALLEFTGDVSAKFLFMVDSPDAMMLTDRILRREVGTTKKIDLYTQSAIQELANIMGSAITNVFNATMNVSVKPTPPVVVCDFAGTIFQEFIMEQAMTQDQVLVMETRFNIVNTDVRCPMIILPSPGMIEKLESVAT